MEVKKALSKSFSSFENVIAVFNILRKGKSIT